MRRAPRNFPAAPAAAVLIVPATSAHDGPASATPGPDILISIGRVELRASAPALRPPQTQAAGRRNEPLSLEAYLAGRNGSSR